MADDLSLLRVTAFLVAWAQEVVQALEVALACRSCVPFYSASFAFRYLSPRSMSWGPAPVNNCL